jgi:hypothetical protein
MCPDLRTFTGWREKANSEAIFEDIRNTKAGSGSTCL